MFGYFVILFVATFHILSCLVADCVNTDGSRTTTKDYCVIGAGPGGLQMGYFLQRAGRDYIILERANISGAFYVRYPRHRKLISINKRYTGKTNKEFNLRHDWNSLLSDDESLQMRHYSKEFFPQADDYVRYLNDYATKLQLNIQYNTDIGNIQRVADATDENVTDHFTMEDQSGNGYTCRYLIVSTGLATSNIPVFGGSEHTESYEDISMDPADFEGQSILILGRGNSAFETADHIIANTNLIHMISRSRVRLAWATHYVGDLRAINNGLLDTYMLKSLDGLIEGDVANMMIFKRHDGKLIIDFADNVRRTKPERSIELDATDRSNSTNDQGILELSDNFAIRDPYDRIIRCLGFKFDFGLFNNQTVPVKQGKGRKKKYPLIKANFEADGVPGLFFAGTNTHSLDFRKSAGGFIHGFRYTARALHRLLEKRNHDIPWPSVRQPITELLNHITKRINEASGTYQMFGVLGDVVILVNNDTEYEYLEEYPLRLLHVLNRLTGKSAQKVFVVSLEYGRDFSGPGKDVFNSHRAVGEPSVAHNSNFLHPVVYFYETLPTLADMETIKDNPGAVLPEPTRLHHTVEDFLTDFTAPVSHILVLRRFLESCLQQDLRYYFDHQCLWFALSHSAPPVSCQRFYMKGQGLPSYGELVGSLTHEQYYGEEEGTRSQPTESDLRYPDKLQSEVKITGFRLNERSEL